MQANQLLPTQQVPNNFFPIITLVTNSVTSQHSKKAYKQALQLFLTWFAASDYPNLTKAAVNEYKSFLLEQEKSAASVNQALSAIRKLAIEATDNGFLDPSLAAGIQRVAGVKKHGVRTGNWLIQQQAQTLIFTPDITTLKGLRDRALIAVFLGAGLRRSEVAKLTYEHIQLRDARWVIVDLVGKGNRVRSIPIPSWTKVAVDDWRQAASHQLGTNELADGRVFRPINKGGCISGESMTPQAIYYTIASYVEEAGLQVTAHDLRRTFAKLAHKGGAPLDQIQLTLGHASIKTTELYLGVEQDLTNAPCDVVGLKLT